MEQAIKILIVEDNVIIADDMQSMLEEIGYEIGSKFEVSGSSPSEHEINNVMDNVNKKK